MTQWNMQNRLQGTTDIPLCDEGIKQVQNLSKRLKTVKIDAIYSSDLKRAFDTADIIAKGHNINISKKGFLREIYFGQWEGKTIKELNKDSEFIKWKAHPNSFVFSDKESLKNKQEKIINSINEVLKNHKNETLIFVSHGCTLKLIIIGLLGLDISSYNKFRLFNASVSTVELSKHKSILTLLNG
jgi:probable phosphoglycerate mutase